MRSLSLKSVLLASAAVLLFVGLASRIAPLADVDGRLLKQWPTEDGYLMLTIARNVALGLGMSTADGTIPTNGTQPLATGLWAAAFLAVDGAKKSGVTIVLLFELLFSCVAPLLLYRVASKLYAGMDSSRAWAALAAGAWFGSAVVVPHTMNALESGLYVVLVLLAADWHLEKGQPTGAGHVHFDWRAIIGMGGILSLCFYARNDAVFLIAAFCLSSVLVPSLTPKIAAGNLPKAFVAGAITVVAALPWLINNITKFGHLMPISGVAQSEFATFGSNAYLLPFVLFEYLSVMLGIPQSFEGNTFATSALTLLVIATLITVAWHAPKLPQRLRPFALFVGLYTFFMVAYYGLFHGAPWFLQRYLFPASPFIAIALIAVVAHALTLPRLRTHAMAVASVLAVGTVGLSVGLNARLYLHGATHMHEQVVDWVLQNVPPTDWIGAVQTGTLGFFHDKTINLDGKVNPEALDAIKIRAIPEYINDKGLVVVADWYGVNEWVDQPGMRGRYRVLVADEDRNLAVIARMDWVPTPSHPDEANQFGIARAAVTSAAQPH